MAINLEHIKQLAAEATSAIAEATNKVARLNLAIAGLASEQGEDSHISTFPQAEIGARMAAEMLGVDVKSLYKGKAGTGCLVKIHNGRSVSYSRAQTLAHIARRRSFGKCDGFAKKRILVKLFRQHPVRSCENVVILARQEAHR